MRTAIAKLRKASRLLKAEPGRIKLKMKPVAVELSSENGNGRGSVELELQPTGVSFSSSEASSESKGWTPMLARCAAFARLVSQRRMTGAEKLFVSAALRVAYNMPANYNEFRKTLSEAVEPTDTDFAAAIASGKGVVDPEIFRAWTALEYLLDHDERDPREIMVEYSDGVSDALEKALKKYNEAEDADISPDVVEGIVEAFIAPYKDAPALRTAAPLDDEEKRQTKMSSKSGEKIVMSIKRALVRLQPTSVKKPDVIIEQAPYLPKSKIQVGWEMKLMTQSQDVIVNAMFVVRRFSDKTYVVSLMARESRGSHNTNTHAPEFKAENIEKVGNAVRQAISYAAALIGRTLGDKIIKPKKTFSPASKKPVKAPIKQTKKVMVTTKKRKAA